jgi:hypothetical protein
MAILAEGGKAGPCVVFWEDEVGTLKDHSLKELWLGPYMTDIRARIAQRKKIPGYCANCCSIVAERTATLRTGLTALYESSISGLSFMAAAKKVSTLFLINLRQRGLRETIGRACARFKIQRKI